MTMFFIATVLVLNKIYICRFMYNSADATLGLVK